MGGGKDKVDIPDEFTVHLDPVKLDGGVEVGLDLTGDLDIDAGLDDINLSVTGSTTQPLSIDLGLDNIKANLGLDNVKVDLGLDDVNVDLGLDNVNVCLSLAVTQVPRVKVHVPTKWEFGFCLFGKPILAYTFAGETMFATEDNPPRIFRQPDSGKRDASSSTSEGDFRVVLNDDEPAGGS